MEKNSRLYCVDILRGLDIFVLLCVCYRILLGAFAIWPPASPKIWMLCRHTLESFAAGPGHVPAGFGLMDFAQPLFVFVTGVSASLAFRKFCRPEGFDTAGFWKRLLNRTLMLWTLGTLIRGALTFKLFAGSTPDFILYSDTLHTIAVAYFGASVGLLLKSAWKRLAVGLVLIGTAAVVLATCGDYTQYGNAARRIDEFVYALLGGKAKDFCYLLTTLSWTGMGILASLAGDVLKGTLAPWRKVRALAVSGLVVFAVGWLVSFAIPPIRYIYTVSFVFETLGLSLLLLAALYVLHDIWNVRRGTGLLLLYGQCSLVAWVTCNFFGRALAAAGERFVVGLPRLLGTAAYQPLFQKIAEVILLTGVIWVWRSFRRVRRQQVPVARDSDAGSRTC